MSMTIEFLNNKWWSCAGEGYSPRPISEPQARELIEKNKLICVEENSDYILYEKGEV